MRVVFFMLIVGSLLFSQNSAEEIFKAKCSSCHKDYIAQSRLNKNYEHNNSDLNLTAPTLTELSFQLREKIGDRRADKESQVMEIEDFLLDYLDHPNRDKSILRKDILKHFKTMPKQHLSDDDAELLSEYMFDFSEEMIVKHSVRRYSYEEALVKAKKENKIVLVEGYIISCRGCIKMDREVFVEDEVKKALDKDFVLVKQNVLAKKLPLGLESLGTPAFYFFTNDGKHLIDGLQGTGNVEEFLDMLSLIIESRDEKKYAQ
jgi:thioredoxin-related protein